MSDESKTAVDDLLKSLLERANSPIAGAFILAWMVANWRIPVALIFGSEQKQDRTALIEGFLQGSTLDRLLYHIVIPALFALLYLLAMPLLKEAHAWWVRRSEYRIIRRQQEMEADLYETKEYRQTLEAICAALKKEATQAQEAFQNISDLASDGLKPSRGDFYNQIRSASEAQGTKLEMAIKSVENFFNNYTGQLPDAYKGFLAKWKR